LIKTVNDIQNDADQAYYMTFGSQKWKTEQYGIGLERPILDEVKKHLDMLKDTT
jgi:hypothetical protein